MENFNLNDLIEPQHVKDAHEFMIAVQEVAAYYIPIGLTIEWNNETSTRLKDFPAIANEMDSFKLSKDHPDINYSANLRSAAKREEENSASETKIQVLISGRDKMLVEEAFKKIDIYALGKNATVGPWKEDIRRVSALIIAVKITDSNDTSHTAYRGGRLYIFEGASKEQ